MKLSQKEKKFIRQNQHNLSSLFERRIEELKDNIFLMEKGENRDQAIRFVNEFKAWLQTIDILTKEEGETTKKPDYL